jgi:HEAT repeats/Tetratricopeptide repeat
MTVGILFAALAFVAVPEPEAFTLQAADQAETREAEARARDDEARQGARVEARRERDEAQKEREENKKAREDSRTDREEDRYERGTEALDEGAWDKAIAAFDDVIQAKGRRADGALYWKAYAKNKQGQREEALKLLAQLGREYPQSRWLKEVRALDAEIRQQSGQAPRPENVADEDLKLMAINGLLNTDAERAIPMLEKLLQGPASRKLQERALFVLTQSNSPRAREIVVRIARGDAEPDLQRKAIQQLGVFGGRESRQSLVEIYASSVDRSVKKAVLQAFLVAGEKDRVLEAARSEKDPELRRDAIQTLGIMGGLTELWGMYQAETVPATKKAILQSLAVGGAVDRLLELARTEKDFELRLDAIQKLGIFGGKRGGDAVVEMYKGESDRRVREAALQALFVQGNAHALVEVARTEKDLELKKRAVTHLSLMQSKEATEFLLEILNK